MFQEAAVVGHSLIQTYVMKIISYLSILKVATLFKTDNIFLLLCVFFFPIDQHPLSLVVVEMLHTIAL